MRTPWRLYSGLGCSALLGAAAGRGRRPGRAPAGGAGPLLHPAQGGQGGEPGGGEGGLSCGGGVGCRIVVEGKQYV